MEIANIFGFIPLFPDGSVNQDSQNEYKSPCPKCDDGKNAQIKNGISFSGEDRLVWNLHQNRFYCRRCQANNRGRGGQGVWLLQDMAELFGVNLAATITTELPPERVEEPLRMLWSEREVQKAHARVDRAFWYRYGWDDATIDYFKLGKGEMYKVDGDVNIIPMRVQKPNESPIEGYGIATRAFGKGTKKKNPGSYKPYLWLIERYPDSKDIVVAEGEKDGISSSMIGWNVATAYGTNMWSEEKTLFLKTLGYERILIFGDNNPAGRDFSLRVAEGCQRAGIPCMILGWSEAEDIALDDDTDTTDILAARGAIAAKAYLTSLLIEPPRVLRRLRGSAIDNYTEYDPNYKPEIDGVNITTLEDVRGRGPKSIYHNVRVFLDEYATRFKRGHGRLKLLSVGPGAGKTYTMVRVVEEEAKKNYEISLVELASIREAITQAEVALTTTDDEDVRKLHEERLRSLRRKEEEFSFSSVSWFAQYKEGWPDLLVAGADEKFWYNYEARTSENCQDFETVQELGANNHDIGTYCKLGCPFRASCKESGYMAQDAEAKHYPIVFYRHQHLNMRQAIAGKRLIVIDENPMALIDGVPIRFSASDVMTANPGWDTEPEEREAAKDILLFANAVANVLKLHTNVAPILIQAGGEQINNPEYVVYGNKLIARIDAQVKSLTDGEDNLEKLMDRIPGKLLNDLYQPTYIGGDRESRLLPRCLPQFYRALSLEMSDYTQDCFADRSSLMFMVGDRIEVYPTSTVKIPSRTPVVLADATAFIPAIYEAMFNRTVDDIYEPTIRNPNAHVTVVTGSDWTLSQIKKQAGKQLDDRKRDLQRSITTLTGEEFDLSQIPVSDELYGVEIIKDALTVIKGLAERHQSMMVVTHKTWREALESSIKGAYPDLYIGNDPSRQRMAFGHFGALRGTNAFKDYEAIALIGMFRIPYDVVFRRAQVWMRHISPTKYEKMDNQTVIKEKPYHGQNKGHGYRTFDHWLADALVCMIEEGEMIQCIERIRPHATNNHKFVYIMANRPFAKFVSGFVGKKELVNHFSNERYIACRQDLAAAFVSGAELPTIRVLAKKHHLSMRDVTKVRNSFLTDMKSPLVDTPSLN